MADNHEPSTMQLTFKNGLTVQRGYAPDRTDRWYACVGDNSLLGGYYMTEAERERAIGDQLRECGVERD